MNPTAEDDMEPNGMPESTDVDHEPDVGPPPVPKVIPMSMGRTAESLRLLGAGQPYKIPSPH